MRFFSSESAASSGEKETVLGILPELPEEG
jgi:hypothetical protein